MANPHGRIHYKYLLYPQESKIGFGAIGVRRVRNITRGGTKNKIFLLKYKYENPITVIYKNVSKI